MSHTGVAGLTLGGGLGWLHRKHGLIDQLLSVDVVTAEGELVDNRRCRLQVFYGSDGTRTRDLRRDRPVMALPG